MNRAALVLGLTIVAPTVAGAEGRTVLVARFAAAEAPARLAARLTAVMSRAAGADGATVIAQSSRDDVLAIAGCASSDTGCLAGAIDLLAVERIVLGEVQADAGGATVRLVRVDAGGDSDTREVELADGTLDEMAAAFAPQAAAFLRGEPALAEAPVAAEPAVTPTATVAVRADRPGFSFAAIEPWTWGVVGGGAAVIGVGAALLLGARGIQADVDDAPTASTADLERLADLEARGRRVTLLGNLALAAGGAAVAVGLVLAIRQGRAGERPAVTARPILVESGAGLALSFEVAP